MGTTFKRFAGLWAIVVFISPGGVLAEVEGFGHADAVVPWWFSHGPEFPGASGKKVWDAREGHDKPGCLVLHHDFTGGGNYVQTGLDLPADNDVRRIRLWLKKPGGHLISFRMTDSAGQTFQKSISYTYDDWQQIEVNLNSWESKWGGPADGKVRFPVRQFGVIINNSDQPRQGDLRIDDVELVKADSSGMTQPTSSYVIADWGADTGWNASGGGRNSLNGRNWQFSFADGRSPGLHKDFSIVGKPSQFRLILESDVAGPSVQVTLYSHFQAFYREIGVLTGTGEQVLQVPLGAMETWKHQGGENDGQLRLPLRMNEIRLRQERGPTEGKVILKRIEVDTELPPGQDVLLVPDARVENGEALFTVRITNVLTRDIAARMVCEIHSISQRVKMETVDLNIPKGKEIKREFRYPMGEYHTLDAVFRWLATDSATRPAYIGIGTVPVEAGTQTLDIHSPIGMGLYLYRWNGDPAAREQMNRVADLAQRAGIKWSREEFQWHRIEPRKGEFDWNFYDQMVEVAHKHGISVYGLLAYWSEWTKPNTVEGIRDYCNWARQVVRRYKGKVNSWEVWNEPNIFFWTGPKEMYADLLARTYETIKSEDPNAIVLGCATSGIDTNFIKMTMERGGKFDALAIHPYRGDLRDLEFMRELRDVRQLVNKRPVWITELGFPTELIEGYSERNQASLVARLYLTALASEAVQNIAWYDFRNDGVDPYEKEQNFGLVRNDLRPKPGYRTLAALGQAIDGCRPGMAVEVGDGAYAFRFVAKDRDVIAVCAPDNGRLLTFMATPPDIHLVNGAGEPVEPFMSDGHATVTLDTGFPIYITGKPGFKLRTAEPVMRLIADRKQARPGNTVTLQLTPFSERVDWELPVNWLIRRTERDGEYSLTIPITAIPGHTQLRAIVRDGGILRLPLTLSIQPQVIKL